MARNFILNGVKFKDGYRAPILGNVMWLWFSVFTFAKLALDFDWIWCALGVVNVILAAVSLVNQIRFYRAMGF